MTQWMEVRYREGVLTRTVSNVSGAWFAQDEVVTSEFFMRGGVYGTDEARVDDRGLKIHSRPFGREDEWWFVPMAMIEQVRYFDSDTCPRCHGTTTIEGEHDEPRWPCSFDWDVEPG
jgi:hypothetical protein